MTDYETTDMPTQMGFRDSRNPAHSETLIREIHQKI